MNIKIYSDGNLSFEEKITNFTYQNDQYLEFTDKYGYHKIDLKQQLLVLGKRKTHLGN